jgi:hypothetical protein
MINRKGFGRKQPWSNGNNSISLIYLELRRDSMPTSLRTVSAWADEQEASRGNYCALIFPEVTDFTG